MPADFEKRKFRELKKAVKKRGNRHRRQEAKHALATNPEEAAHAEEDLGRHRSAAMNGHDQDATRRGNRAGEQGRGGAGEKDQEATG